MKYLLLINEDESVYQDENGEALMQEVVGKHMALIEQMNAAGIYAGGERLQPGATATTIKWDYGSHALHDGPFAETHEELGGYYIVDVPDLDQALEWAKKIPIPGKGAIEVRPVWEMG